MARGRIISSRISTSKRLTQVSDRAALIFSWLVSHTDDYGRMDGDAFSVRAKVVPTRGYSEDEVEECIKSLEKVGLIERYDTDGSTYLEIVNFEDHQTFRYDRNRVAKYPLPPVNGFLLESEMVERIAMTLESYEKGLEFVDTEYYIPRKNELGMNRQIGACRVDILCIDSAQTLVLIEVKREMVRGFTITQQVLKSKQLFAAITKQKARFVIIAPSFTDEAKIEAQNNDIELWVYQGTTSVGKRQSNLSESKLSESKRTGSKLKSIREILKSNSGKRT